MNIISIILSRNGINRLKASGGVGYSDGGGSLKFNDDFDSTVYLEAFRRVTDKTYKVDAIKSITLRDTEEESTIAPQGFIDLKGDGSIYVESSEAIFIVYKQAEMEGGTVLPVGTYFTHIESAEVLSIEFTETIHPVDPKYIPGAVLPVVELSTIPNSDGADLSAEEASAVNDCFAKRTPFIGKFYAGEGMGEFSVTFNLSHVEGIITMYSAITVTEGLIPFMVVYDLEKEAWVFAVGSM